MYARGARDNWQLCLYDFSSFPLLEPTETRYMADDHIESMGFQNKYLSKYGKLVKYENNIPSNTEIFFKKSSKFSFLKYSIVHG